MTGYGAATAHEGGTDYHVELRSVNNRYFKASMRLPDALQSLESEIEIALRKHLSRGTVTVRASISESSARAAYTINAGALRSYVDAVMAAWPKGEAPLRLDLGGLLSLPGVVQPPGDEDDRLESARRVLLPLVDKACASLISMREREGAALADDLLARHAEIAVRLAEIERRSPDVAVAYERRLKARIEALLTDASIKLDQVDLVREIAVYAERTDIAEEITRLRTHLDQFAQRVRSGGESVGRTLEFIGQELLREANTIASKSPDADVSRLAVEIKGSIDRIKEQVQNVE